MSGARKSFHPVIRWKRSPVACCLCRRRHRRRRKIKSRAARPQVSSREKVATKFAADMRAAIERRRRRRRRRSLMRRTTCGRASRASLACRWPPTERWRGESGRSVVTQSVGLVFHVFVRECVPLAQLSATEANRRNKARVHYWAHYTSEWSPRRGSISKSASSRRLRRLPRRRFFFF